MDFQTNLNSFLKSCRSFLSHFAAVKALWWPPKPNQQKTVNRSILFEQPTFAAFRAADSSE
jgi:hypothetical protein